MSGGPKFHTLNGRTGSYAVTTVNIDDWTNTAAVKTPSKIRKSKAVKEIKHPIFNECSKLTEDPFWRQKFIQASTGKFPRYFSYSDGTLSYKRGARISNLTVPNDPHEALYACTDFFRSNKCIFSPTDQQLADQARQEHINAGQESLTWTSASKKMKDCLVLGYVEDLRDTLKLSKVEEKQLEETINIGVQTKCFTKHNIAMDYNRIASIQGLCFDNQERKFFVDPRIKPTAVRASTRSKNKPWVAEPGTEDMIPNFMVHWRKYLRCVEEQYNIEWHKALRHASPNPPKGITLRIVDDEPTTTPTNSLTTSEK